MAVVIKASAPPMGLGLLKELLYRNEQRRRQKEEEEAGEGDATAGAAAGAVSGAAAGSAGGPIGAVIGGVVGGAAGYFGAKGSGGGGGGGGGGGSGRSRRRSRSYSQNAGQVANAAMTLVGNKFGTSLPPSQAQIAETEHGYALELADIRNEAALERGYLSKTGTTPRDTAKTAVRDAQAEFREWQKTQPEFGVLDQQQSHELEQMTFAADRMVAEAGLESTYEGAPQERIKQLNQAMNYMTENNAQGTKGWNDQRTAMGLSQLAGEMRQVKKETRIPKPKPNAKAHFSEGGDLIEGTDLYGYSNGKGDYKVIRYSPPDDGYKEAQAAFDKDMDAYVEDGIKAWAPPKGFEETNPDHIRERSFQKAKLKRGLEQDFRMARTDPREQRRVNSAPPNAQSIAPPPGATPPPQPPPGPQGQSVFGPNAMGPGAGPGGPTQRGPGGVPQGPQQAPPSPQQQQQMQMQQQMQQAVQAEMGASRTLLQRGLELEGDKKVADWKKSTVDALAPLAGDMIKLIKMNHEGRGDLPPNTKKILERATQIVERHKQGGPSKSKGKKAPDDARNGEYGSHQRLDDPTAWSDEVSITLQIPELGPDWFNIPTFVKGNDLNKLLSGPTTPEQEKVAVRRAIERVRNGASLPSYKTVEEAVKAAEARHNTKGKNTGRK